MHYFQNHLAPKVMCTAYLEGMRVTTRQPYLAHIPTESKLWKKIRGVTVLLYNTTQNCQKPLKIINSQKDGIFPSVPPLKTLSSLAHIKLKKDCIKGNRNWEVRPLPRGFCFLYKSSWVQCFDESSQTLYFIYTEIS